MTVRREHLTFCKNSRATFCQHPAKQDGEYANGCGASVFFLSLWVQLKVSELLLIATALLCFHTKAPGVTFRRPASRGNWGLYGAQQSHCTGGGSVREIAGSLLSVWWGKKTGGTLEYRNKLGLHAGLRRVLCKMADRQQTRRYSAPSKSQLILTVEESLKYEMFLNTFEIRKRQ